ncbi:50S ribosomal protein L28 [Candidatus Similichlamydia epinepheli]|uniref:50S ribosomal protein L28 n=1 Tax=Candidatus Similichlamydia epinepheli TaxID=1903953 RepID=UPI000D341518|nr:50S ribosomal protein L28 [Candidatus Similichlamydia epinepheli]
MSRRVCQITGRATRAGMSYSMRGIAKKKKGIGLKVAGKSRRVFKSNVHRKRVWIHELGRSVLLSISAAGLRTLEKAGAGKFRSRLCRNPNKKRRRA